MKTTLVTLLLLSLVLTGCMYDSGGGYGYSGGSYGYRNYGDRGASDHGWAGGQGWGDNDHPGPHNGAQGQHGDWQQH